MICIILMDDRNAVTLKGRPQWPIQHQREYSVSSREFDADLASHCV